MFNVSSGNESLHFWVVYLDCNVSGGEYDGSAAWNHATISPMSVLCPGIWLRWNLDMDLDHEVSKESNRIPLL